MDATVIDVIGHLMHYVVQNAVRRDDKTVSMNVATAIHIDGRACDVGCEFRRKKQARTSNIHRLAQALEWNAGGNLVGHWLCHVSGEHAGLERLRCNQTKWRGLAAILRRPKESLADADPRVRPRCRPPFDQRAEFIALQAAEKCAHRRRLVAHTRAIHPYLPRAMVAITSARLNGLAWQSSTT
jgi:hypothetical protein